jgi:hypothetical protein
MLFYVRFVAGRVHEGILVSGFPALILFFQSEIAAVGAEENIARQALQHFEAVLLVAGDLRIFLVAHQFVAGIYIRTADDDHMECLAALGFIHGPGGSSFGVTGSEMSDQHGAAKFHFVSVVQLAILPACISLCGTIPIT